MNNFIKACIIILFIISIPICIYIISSVDLTSRESSMLSIILAIFSILATWVVTHLYSESQHKKAIQEVQEFHRTNLQTYAKKAAEKVNNLSNELSRLSAYLTGELDRSDLENPNEALLSLEERIASSIHLVNTLKSVNDTALSDWEGVIDDLLDQQREEKEEREEELMQMITRLQSLWDAQIDYVHDKSQNREVLSQIDAIRKDLRSMAMNFGITQIPLRKKTRKTKNDVQSLCPECGTLIQYRQRPLVSGYKSVKCNSCGTSFISRFREKEGFVLETRRLVVENFQCPLCSSELSLELDTLPTSLIEVACKNCKEQIRVSRTVEGGISIKPKKRPDSTKPKVEPNEEIILKVKEKLPPQPWPKGVHKTVADELDIGTNIVTRSITELIRRGVFKPQIDGQIFVPESPISTNKQSTKNITDPSIQNSTTK